MHVYSIRTDMNNLVEIKEVRIIKETEKTITVEAGMLERRINKREFTEGDKLYHSWSQLYGTDLNYLINKFNEYLNSEIEQYKQIIIDNKKQMITSIETIIDKIKNNEIYRKSEG